MKAPLILGNDIPKMDAQTLSVLANADAIAINQDPLGIQAQRVAVTAPSPTALFAPDSSVGKNVAILARCDASRATQQWRLSAGALSTVDTAGTRWCLVSERAEEGGWVVTPCADGVSRATAFTTSTSPAGLVTLRTGAHVAGWNVGAYASGPIPFSRYITEPAAEYAHHFSWLADLSAASGTGTPFMAADRETILSHDNVGGQSVLGGDFCLDVTAGQLEVWAGPLTGGRYAVSLFNRSPADAPITVNWSSFNVSATASFAVRDVWAAKDMGTHTGSYTDTVATLSTTLLLLTPA